MNISEENKQSFSILSQIFNNFPPEYLYLNDTPNFQSIHLSHLNKKEQFLKLEKLCRESKSSYANMILGLISEKGLTSEKNLKNALKHYKKGASQNDAYCLYRLFFIYKNEAKIFDVLEDNFLLFGFLFQSAAYFDEKDNRFSDKTIDPILHLAVCFEMNKNEMEKLITSYLSLTEKEEDQKKQLFTSKFLLNWYYIKFPSNEHEKKKAIDNQKVLALTNPEAAYHIGDCFRWGGETLPKKIDDSIKFLTLAADHDLIKAIESLSIIYIEENNYENAIFWLKKGEELGSYLCIKFLGEYEISGKVLQLDIKNGLNKLKRAFYFGDFWAAWTIIIVYKYISSVEEGKKRRKIFKYSDILYSCKDIMGNIVYITIRHSSLASCFEKAICVDRDYNKALKLHLDCLFEIKKECWKGYTYYKIGKLYEKSGNIPKSKEFYYKGYKARSEFIKKEQKKEPPHFYNYGNMFAFGRGVPQNLELAYKYFKLGAEFNSFLSFHLVYGNKCNKKLSEIEKKLNQILVTNYNLKEKNNELKINKIDQKCLEAANLIKIDQNNENIELFFGNMQLTSLNNKENPEKNIKNIMIYKIKNISFDFYWKIMKKIFLLQSSEIFSEKYPKIYGVSIAPKDKEMIIICNNESKFNFLRIYLKSKPNLDTKNRILSNILSFDLNKLFKENFIGSIDENTFLVAEKDNAQVLFSLSSLLLNEENKINENKLVNDFVNVIRELFKLEKNNRMLEGKDANKKKNSLFLSELESNKIWNMEELCSLLNSNNIQKTTNKSKFFNF